MLARLGRWARARAESRNPWTNVYGLARTILATATASTLLATHESVLFHPVAGPAGDPPFCVQYPLRAGLFCLAPSDHLGFARYIGAALLLVVASGWRPRITGLLHWWVSASLQVNAVCVDGGDQATAVLTLLLLPLTLTDSRTWHWQSCGAEPVTEMLLRRRLIALGGHMLIRLQVAGIYFHAAIAKFSVPEWADGTALYYFFRHPTFGASSWLAPALTLLLGSGVGLSLVTWSVLVFEYFMSTGLVMPPRGRRLLLGLGILFHSGIILIHGLVTFSVAMMAALVLYLRPLEAEFSLSRVLAVPGFMRRLRWSGRAPQRA